MIRRALNKIPQLSILAKSQIATRCMGLFIHALMENTCEATVSTELRATARTLTPAFRDWRG